MHHSVRTLACLIGISSIAILPTAACSSSSSTKQPGFDGGQTDTGSPEVDAGHDSGHDAKAKDAAKDTGKKDATNDAKDDVTHADASDHDGATDAAKEGSDHDGAAHDGATDGDHDGAKDAEGDAHDAAAAPPVQNFFMGRWDTSGVTTMNTATGVGSIAAWPGSGVITTFMGPNIGLSLTETCNAGTPTACDTVTVELDGVAVSKVVLNGTTVTSATNAFALVNAANTIQINSTLYTQLATGKHTIGVFKNTDPFYAGQFTFGGFTPANMLASNNPAESYTFTHRIEFVGDDNTAGTGDLGTAPTCDPATTTLDNEYDSYANLVAKHFTAERQNLSLPNVGVYEGDPPTDEGGPLLISQLYPLVLPSEAMSTWSFTSFTPDLVVVNIGAYGDFDNVLNSGTPVNPASFNTNYEQSLEALLTTIRAKHATAFILVTVGPGYGGGMTDSPSDLNSWAGIAVQARITAMAETSSTIAFFAPNIMTDTYQGCSYRPDVTDQSNMATQIEGEIHTLLGW